MTADEFVKRSKMANMKNNQVYTGGYSHNDPYQYAQDNKLGPIECDVIAYVTRHGRGEASGQKYGARDVLAAMASLARLAIDRYSVSRSEAVGVVEEMYRRRSAPEVAKPLDESPNTGVPDFGEEVNLGWPIPGELVEMIGNPSDPFVKRLRPIGG